MDAQNYFADVVQQMWSSACGEHTRIFQSDGWIVAENIASSVASQGNVVEEAVENLTEALTLHGQTPVASFRSERKYCLSFCSMHSFPLVESLKLSFRQIRFKLENAGFTEVRQRGSHAKFVKREHDRVSTAILPHYTDVSAAVLCSILCQSGLEAEEFQQL